MKILESIFDRNFPFIALATQIATLALLVTLLVVLNGIADNATNKSLGKITQQHAALEHEIQQIAISAGLPVPTNNPVISGHTSAPITPAPTAPASTARPLPTLPLHPTPPICVTIPGIVKVCQ